MYNFFISLVLFGSISIMCSGCDNVGNAPQGSTEQVKKDIDALSPQKQIAQWQYSPLPAAEKEKKIQEIEKKYGITRDAPAGTATPGR